MIEICLTCGRRKPNPDNGSDSFGSFSDNTFCRYPDHRDTVDVTDNQARDLAQAAKAYNAAREIEDRSAALNDWLGVLAGTEPAEAPEQDDLFASLSEPSLTRVEDVR